MASKTKRTTNGPSDLVETHMEMYRRLLGDFGHGTPAKKVKKG